MQPEFTARTDNTMNSFAASSIMGFVDKELNPRYMNSDFNGLLDKFCEIVVELKPRLAAVIPEELWAKDRLKAKIMELVQGGAIIILQRPIMIQLPMRK